MPYISADRRQAFDQALEMLALEVRDQGELNYCIFKLSRLIIDRIGESYANLSMCSSAMEHAKLEWYRKALVPYEEKKIQENGGI
ncbi:DUF6899 family protein [Desulfonatronovibrio hydrogenovorans]|uniref:DUF6899 family protein n=1 Tax=Desulfonatronovibrio hydrogenovorans TaxID=53245 RepID=UPI000490675D|nr:hypothetical protein [Desulfonatronovibrio hydrogenovorans]